MAAINCKEAQKTRYAKFTISLIKVSNRKFIAGAYTSGRCPLAGGLDEHFSTYTRLMHLQEALTGAAFEKSLLVSCKVVRGILIPEGTVNHKDQFWDYYYL